MFLAAFIWIMFKIEYGYTGLLSNMPHIGLAIGGYYVIKGKPKPKKKKEDDKVK